jgi:hypothetical protein
MSSVHPHSIRAMTAKGRVVTAVCLDSVTLYLCDDRQGSGHDQGCMEAVMFYLTDGHFSIWHRSCTMAWE